MWGAPIGTLMVPASPFQHQKYYRYILLLGYKWILALLPSPILSGDASNKYVCIWLMLNDGPIINGTEIAWWFQVRIQFRIKPDKNL